MSGVSFLAAEASIVAQLKAVIQTGAAAWARLVATRAELASVAEERQLTPAAYVVYDGYTVLAANQFEAVLAHRWLVIVAVSSAARQRESSPLNEEAGPYIWDVIRALHGFVPAGASKALIPATPPRPYFPDSGFAYFPVAFVCEARHTIRQGVLSAPPGRI